MLQFQIHKGGYGKDDFGDIFDFSMENIALSNQGEITRSLKQIDFEGNVGPADLFGYSSEIIVAFGGTAGAMAFLKYLADKAIDWKKISEGRSIRARVGDREIEIKGSIDINIALDLLKNLEKQKNKDRDEE